MQNIFSKSFDLRTSDFDKNQRLHPSAILDLFQVVAGEHANILGCGIDALAGKDLLWVLVRTKYLVLKQPKMFSRVVVKTWPLAPSRVGFQREYLMENEAGEPLVKASSDWVIINSSTRKIAPASNIYPEGLVHLEDKSFEGRLSKIADFEVTDNGISVIPGYSQLDMNGHVNNTKYANYVLDALNPDMEEIVEFQIDYRHEVKSGERLNVYPCRLGEKAFVKGVSEDGELKFMAEMLIR